MEFPEILERIKKNCDVVLLPVMKPFEIKEKYGIPCYSKEQDKFIYLWQLAQREGREPCASAYSRVMRLNGDGYDISQKAQKYVLSGNAHMISNKCCEYIKKKPMKRYLRKVKKKAILGVKGGESVLRRAQYTSCFTKDGKFTPLWDLTDEIEDEIYKKYNIEIPEIYKYVSRTGCAACPYGSWRHETQKQLSLLKGNQKKFIMEYFKESYEALGVKEESVDDRGTRCKQSGDNE